METVQSAGQRRKRQKKYRQRTEILKDIAAAERKHARLLSKAQAALDAEEFYKMTDNTVERTKHREEADKLLGKAKRLHETRMRKLGATLAAFDTKPLQVDGLNVEQAVLGG